MGGAWESYLDSTAFWDGNGILGCSVCGFMCDRLCDYPLGRGKTCSARLCDEHALVQPDGDLDFCPKHDAMVGVRGKPRLTHEEHARCAILASERALQWAKTEQERTGVAPRILAQQARWIEEYEAAANIARSEDQAGICHHCKLPIFRSET